MCSVLQQHKGRFLHHKGRFPHRLQILPSATSQSCISMISVKVINSTTGKLHYLEYCGELNLVVKSKLPYGVNIVHVKHQGQIS